MDRVIALNDVVRQQISTYATDGYNLAGQRIKLYFVENPQEQVFAILGPYDPVDGKAELVLMARIIDNQVIIDFDKTSKPLYNALKRAGVPEHQIIIASRQTK